MKTKPNVLFIMSDQHSAKVVGHKGIFPVKTPGLDRLAAEGVRFDCCVTQNPICTPSRVSFHSSQYCHNHGYYALSGPAPRGLPTVFGWFRHAGYRTAAIGKIHCPAGWIEKDCDTFIDAVGTSIGGNPEYRSYLEERGVSGKSLNQRTFYEKHTGKDAEDLRREDPSLYLRTCDGGPSELLHEDTPEGFSVRKAVDFMQETSHQGEPFFVHASFEKPHQLYSPSQRFWDLYDEPELRLPPNMEYEMAGKSPHLRQDADFWRNADWSVFEPRDFESAARRRLRGYLGNVSQVDYSVGELLDYLDTSGLANDTIVVYTADHGDYVCEHGCMEKAPGICADAITRIPFIWRWPRRFASGRMITEIVEAVDTGPTLASLAGLDPMTWADGKDIRSLLEGECGEIHRVGVTENPWAKSVRWGGYRLVWYPNEFFAADYPEGFGELYDLQEDPWEMNNLYWQEKYRPVVRRMERELMDWLVTTTRVVTFPWGLRANTFSDEFLDGDGKLNPRRFKPFQTQHYV
jgi:arylsulfatase A-like enzyme